jgi:hypothetical protein
MRHPARAAVVANLLARLARCSSSGQPGQYIEVPIGVLRIALADAYEAGRAPTTTKGGAR